MIDGLYEDLALERSMKAAFGVDLVIQQTIARIPVSHTSEATVFLTDKKQLYVAITGQSKLVLGDVKKIINRMGLKAEAFLPPKGRPQYFDEVGRAKFLEVFPGRTQVNDQDIHFYRTLAPYSPALVIISEVKDGHILQFDIDSTSGWRIAKKFTYRRIKTS